MRRAKERCGTACGIEGLFSGKQFGHRAFQFSQVCAFTALTDSGALH
ncbi:MAG: hypothetical protein ACLVAW_08345 [Eisenbergiella massiliensis]